MLIKVFACKLFYAPLSTSRRGVSSKQDVHAMNMSGLKKFYYSFPVTSYVLAAIAAALAILIIEGWPGF